MDRVNGAEKKAGSRGPGTGWKLAIVSAITATAIFALGGTVADPDLWGHVRFGQLIRRLGGVPRGEPFSYMADSWINHEWMAEVTFAAAYDAAGAAGLVGLKVVLGLLVFGIAYRYLSRQGLDVMRAGFIALAGILLLLFGLPPVRPQLFTYLFFLLLLLVVTAVEDGRRRWLWALPPLFAVWVNFHGGFLAGLGVLAIWWTVRAGRDLLESRQLLRALRGNAGVLAAGVASTLATWINPYGVDLFLFVLRTATVPRPEITEWNPVRPASLEGAFYLAFVALILVALVRSDRKRTPVQLALLGVTGFLPLMAFRHLPLFALSGVVIAAPHLAAAYRRRPSQARSKHHRTATAGATCVAAGLLFATFVRGSCIELGPPMSYPTRALGLVERSGFEGNLFVFFNWGEYALWHLAPEVQVAVDGRRETVYPDSVYRDYLQFMVGVGEDWSAPIDQWPTELVLVPTGYPVLNMLKLRPDWQVVYEDSIAGLFAPAGSAQLRRLTETPVPDLPVDGEGMCFG